MGTRGKGESQRTGVVHAMALQVVGPSRNVLASGVVAAMHCNGGLQVPVCQAGAREKFRCCADSCVEN